MILDNIFQILKQKVMILLSLKMLSMIIDRVYQLLVLHLNFTF